MMRSWKRDMDIARGHGAFCRTDDDAGGFVRDNAGLVLDIMSFDADDFSRMEHEAMTVGSAVCGGDGGCATGTLMDDVRGVSHGTIDKMHTGMTIMYPMVLPQPWQQRVCVRHSQVRGGTLEARGRQGERQRRASGLGE